MAIKFTGKNNEALLDVEVTGKLTPEGHRHSGPRFEEMLEEPGKPAVLFEEVDFHGRDAGALWDDTKFDLRLNYLVASHVWQQDHNGFTHQDPGK
jgi:D-xylulose 5-phosphate/D-fructose 6-phosphate phosphoketolase